MKRDTRSVVKRYKGAPELVAALVCESWMAEVEVPEMRRRYPSKSVRTFKRTVRAGGIEIPVVAIVVTEPEARK